METDQQYADALEKLDNDPWFPFEEENFVLAELLIDQSTPKLRDFSNAYVLVEKFLQDNKLPFAPGLFLSRWTTWRHVQFTKSSTITLTIGG